jgi:hypothetical protein
MPETTTDLRATIQGLLASSLDRGSLLRELETLARTRGFDACADLWAPALYARDPYFFETFLLRHLDDDNEDTIRTLLPRAEADGNDLLFAGLYHKVADEASWNADLLTLARSLDPDATVASAVRRRARSRMRYSLSEETALTLYRRNPTLFRDFVRDHVHDDGESNDNFARLRAEVRRQDDLDLYWSLFRELADADEWTRELGDLLAQNPPAAIVDGELRKRQPEVPYRFDAHILADYLTRYGWAIVPYLEANMEWIARSAGASLLEAAERLDDDALYWRIFFHVGDSKRWNRALRHLLKEPLADDALLYALQRRTPPAGRPSTWRLDDEVALALYRRNPGLFRPFLERCIDDADISLFMEAERARDEDFLDFLTADLMRQVTWLIVRAYPPESQYRLNKPNAGAREGIEQLGRAVTARFDRLYAESPDTYVRHAADILSRFDESDIGSFKRTLERNPIFVYLFRQHRAAWHASPTAVREVLESPSTQVQLVGLTILSEGGPQAAQRVVENIALLRALLLGRAQRNTKKLVLACLAQAARQSPEHAETIAHVLEDTLHFSGKHAIDERIMVSYVRLRRLAAERSVAPQTA